MLERLSVWFVKRMAWVIRRLPLAFSLFLARSLGLLVYGLDHRRFVAYANLKAAFPGRFSPREIKRIIRSTYRHFVQALAEMLYFPKMDKAYMNRYVEWCGFENFQRAVSNKNGSMFMTAHFGNWELTQICSSLKGHPMGVLAREQRHGLLDEFLNQLRSSHGSYSIFTGGPRTRNLIEALRGGKLIGVLGDQGGGRNGMIAEFFGRKTTVPSGLMSIAKRTRTLVIPVFMVRKRGPFHQLCLTEPLELVDTGNEEKDDAENYQRYLKELEAFIARYPDQWLWNYKRWKFCFTKRIVVLEDERAGHAVQALAVASELKTAFTDRWREADVDITPVPVRFKSKWHRAFFSVCSLFVSSFAQSRLGALKWFLQEDSVRALNAIPYADAVVSCGAGLTPLVGWLRNEFLAKTVLVMKPSFPYSLFRYDLVVLPKHDGVCRLKSRHVRTSVAPNLVTEAFLSQSGEKLKEHLKPGSRRMMAVFIGGSTKHYHFEAAKVEAWIQTFAQAAEALDFDFMITTSRRTDQETARRIKTAFGSHPRCRLLVIAHEKNIEQVTYGMLALSDLALASEDSVSMISEALSASKPVVVFRLSERGLPKKHARFQNMLAAENLIHIAAPSDLQSKLETAARLHHQPAAQLIHREREEVRDALRSLT